jgi:hypothetical protein
MNIEKEINSILEKFIIHLYDDFDFEEAKLKIERELKIQSDCELKDYYYTEEEVYDMYWFGTKYVREKFLVNSNSNDDILEKICKEELQDNYYDVFNVILDQLGLYYRKYYGTDAKRLMNELIKEVKSIKDIIMTYLSFYYCENQEHVQIIIDSVINANILK